MEKDISQIDWVSELSACSLVKVFERLKLQVKQDVDQRRASAPQGTPYMLEIAGEGDRFVVLLQGHRGLVDSVTFQHANKKISVFDKHDKTMFEATPSLNDEGECVLKVNDKERHLWQVRKMALENLLFGYF